MIKNKITKQTSEIISKSRFPLMVMVVLIHAKLSSHKNFEVYNLIEFTLSDFICRVAVPLFYSISGYLFFTKSSLSFKSLQSKLQKRVYSLLIPYILWNIIVLVIMIITELCLPSFRSGTTKPILQYSFLDYIYSLWDTNLINNIGGSGEPICFQFWFLRDLMISMIIIPIISILIKSKIFEFIFISTLWILWIIDVTIPIPGFSIVSFFFFYSGLFLYKYNIHISKILSNEIIVIFSIIYICFYSYTYFTNSQIALKISIIIGILVFFNSIKYLNLTKDNKIKNIYNFLSQSSFFLYAAHGVIITFLVKFTVRIIPQNDLIYSLMYIVNPIITILICEEMYWYLKNKWPKIESILTGKR